MPRYTSPFPVALVVCMTMARLPAQEIATAAEVRALSPAEADRGRPARLRGSVTFVEGPSAIFLEDETSGTFFRVHKLGPLHAGDRIEVTGKTRMGLYLPGLDYAELRILGSGPLPPAIPAAFEDLVSGRYHYRRVAVEGVVRSVAPVDEGRSLLRLAMGSRVVDVQVEMPVDLELTLVDSRVRVAGLAAGLLNERHQLIRPYLRVIDWGDISILERAPNVDQVPTISADELLAFSAKGRSAHRCRLTGLVTAVFAPSTAHLRAGQSAFEVNFVRPEVLVAGDTVEIAGFPEMNRFNASVADAVVVLRKSGVPPVPRGLASPDELAGQHDGDLVTFPARVAETLKTSEAVVLVLQGPNRSVQLRMPDSFEPPPPGSRVQATGVCTVEAGAPRSSGYVTLARIFSLRARGPGDLTVLQSPPWWTVQKLVVVLGGLATLVLLASLWISALRRQVGRQTAALRGGIESEAALEERHRIAREFHDSLEQDLAGLGLRLDAVATRAIDDKGRALIAGSRGLVSRIQAETRNLVSDLRDPAETAGDLAGVLRAVADEHVDKERITLSVKLPLAPPPLLAATVVHHLRMIARESVTNALKHGGSTLVTLALQVKENALVLSIADNGMGFDPALADRGKAGHFGCVGIRERARRIGAAVVWRSAPGAGVTVELTLPLGG